MKRIHFMIGNFVMLKILDVTSTYYLINKGLGEEVNPLMKPFIQNRIFIISFTIIQICGLICTNKYLTDKQNKKLLILFEILLYLLNLTGAFVVGHNIGIIFRFLKNKEISLSYKIKKILNLTVNT